MYRIIKTNQLVSSLRSTDYFARGAICRIRNNIILVIGGATTLYNYNSNPRFLESELPIFKYFKPGAPIKINLGNGSPILRTVASVVNNYVIEITTNYNIAAAGIECHVCVDFNLLTYPPSSIFENTEFNISIANQAALQYISLISGYNIGWYDDLGSLQSVLGYNPFQFITSSASHKPIDYGITPLALGWGLTSIPYGNDSGTNGITAVEIDFGAMYPFFNEISNKVNGLYSTRKELYLLTNPYYLGDLSGNKTALCNIASRFQPVKFQSIDEIKDESSIELYQFGDFGERGNGQIAQWKPTNISINSGAGLAFNTSTQTLEFTLPIQANLTDNTVYIVMIRRIDANSSLNLDNFTTQEFGQTIGFALPFGTATLTYPNQLATINSVSITPVSGGYRYLFNFNIIRLTDIINWGGILCYVVIDTPQAVESHTLFEAQPATPPVTIPYPSFISSVETAYNNNSDIIRLVPYNTSPIKCTFDLTPILTTSGVKLRKIKAKVATTPYDVVLQQFEINIANHQQSPSGYPVLDEWIGSQGGNSSNNSPTHFHVFCNGTATLEITIPIVNRDEPWLPLQPNHGAFYNNLLPNNGQSYDFVNYLDATPEILIEYEYNGVYQQNYLLPLIEYFDINTTHPSPPPPDSSIVGFFSLSGSPLSQLEEGGTYILRLDHLQYMPSEQVAVIKMGFEGQDNITTFGSIYPNDSRFFTVLGATYKNWFISQSGDDFKFTLPNRTGKLRAWVVFAKPDTIDKTITRIIAIDVLPKPTILPSTTFVTHECCEPKIVLNTDKTLLFWGDGLLNILKDGQTVHTVVDNTYGVFYAYDPEFGYSFFTANWQAIYNAFGEGEYSFMSGGNPVGGIYCLTSDNQLVNRTVYIEATLDRKVNKMDFKEYPITAGIRCDGFISSINVSSESEEVALLSNKSVLTNVIIKKTLNLTIKRIYKDDYDLLSLLMAAKKWQITEFNTQNVLSGTYVCLPAKSLSPEFKFGRNFASLELELDFEEFLNTQNC